MTIDVLAEDLQPGVLLELSTESGTQALRLTYVERRTQGIKFMELLQRCPSSVRMALAIDVMRLGLHRDLRKIRQDFSLATPSSTGARAAAGA